MTIINGYTPYVPAIFDSIGQTNLTKMHGLKLSFVLFILCEAIKSEDISFYQLKIIMIFSYSRKVLVYIPMFQAI